MHSSLSPLLAAAFPWMNLVWVLLGISGFLCALALVGRFLAATHPDAPARPAAETPAPPATDTVVEIDVVIAAAVHAAFGDAVKIKAVVPQEQVKLSVDSLMLQWSLEGRREIYSSHRVR